MNMSTTPLLLSAVLLVASLPGLSTAADQPASTKKTFLVIYRPGPAWPQGKLLADLPLNEHFNYLLSQFAKRSMKMAGPLTDDAGGAVVLEVADEAEAKAIVAGDPAVKSGLFAHEMHPWAPVQWEKYLKK